MAEQWDVFREWFCSANIGVPKCIPKHDIIGSIYVYAGKEFHNEGITFM
jgi:hypothetical protein